MFESFESGALHEFEPHVFGNVKMENFAISIETNQTTSANLYNVWNLYEQKKNRLHIRVGWNEILNASKLEIIILEHTHLRWLYYQLISQTICAASRT